MNVIEDVSERMAADAKKLLLDSLMLNQETSDIPVFMVLDGRNNYPYGNYFNFNTAYDIKLKDDTYRNIEVIYVKSDIGTCPY